ncbi:MAG TPA: extracellular solute-binding protein [Candidatus Alectryocaccomicrobium excrementavium]|uniref:Extracellular solute-binding protein n=1 Tax=Candidatus Alectryocaccomicrobium excrementavium TaxID=2840668 RepID=A0A9D1FXL0_9FIRM|nr:extracellular solute-binding protein [Candidatus Alectryocaccomicrobium excrementavium]
MKKLLVLALALSMALSMVPVIAESDTATEPTATFSIWTWLGSAEGWGCETYDQIACFQEAEAATQTDIVWEIESDTSTFDLMMSSGDTTDGIYYAWNPVRTATYSQAGLIVDIAPYIAENMPNLNALIESDPLIKKQLTSADGGIYFVPWVTADKSLVYGEGFGIRADWLEKVGMEMPTTTDELYAVLKAFRDQDVNGNGQNDEIITGYPSQINRLAYAFGTADDWHYAEDGVTVVYGPMTDNYKEWLKFMNTLYNDGILDPDYFMNDSDIYMSKVQEDRVGLYCDNPGVFGTMMKDGAANGLDLEYVPMPYIGGQNLSSAARRYVQPYGVAISSSCEDVGRFLQYLDFFFTEEGNTLLNWGVEGVSYEVVDGVKTYTDEVLNNEIYEASTALSQYAHPTFVGVQSGEADMALLSEEQRAFKETWAQSDASLAIEPFLAFTEEETDINTQKETDLTTARSSWRDKFITGERDIETEWDAYLEELRAYGVEELLAVRQAASDRYNAK